MSELPLGLWVALTAVFSLILFSVTLRYYTRWMGTRRRQRGLRAERNAESLLARNGYKVQLRNPKLKGHVIIDGERHATTLHGDLVVRRSNKQFLVEVKSGQYASATREATRRQLLEYWLNSEYDGMLLVDTQEGSIQSISFDYPVSA